MLHNRPPKLAISCKKLAALAAIGIALLSVCTSVRASSLTDMLTNAAGKLQEMNAATKPNPTAAQTTSTPPANNTAPTLLNARPADSVQQLFSKHTVTGADLINELMALQNSPSRNALAGVVANTSSELHGANSTGIDVQGKIMDVALHFLNDQVVSYSHSTLDSYMNTLTGNKDALNKESIDLPAVSTTNTMTLSQKQSVLTMAALVVAARISHKTLDAAKKNFDGLEKEYTALLDRRAKTAELMADVVDRRRKAIAAKDELATRQIEADMSQWLSKEDMAFIDAFGADRPLQDFANDLGMQNLALQFLRHSDPQAYADYRAQTDGLMGRSRAYLQTMAGVAAFGGFTALFTKEVAKIASEKNTSATLSAMPFAWAFVQEAIPSMKLSVETLYTGIVIEPTRSSHNYRVAQGEQLTDVAHAKNVFESLAAGHEEQRFTDALFRDDAPGFLYHVYLCDAPQAGHMMDMAVPSINRKQFAESYLQVADSSDFLFSNLLSDSTTASTNNAAPADVVTPLLARDQRTRADSVQIGEVQRLTVSNYTHWNDSELTRLILANNEGAYAHAQMQLGNITVHLIPSMTAIYAYETYADSCRHTANQTTASTPTQKPKS